MSTPVTSNELPEVAALRTAIAEAHEAGVSSSDLTAVVDDALAAIWNLIDARTREATRTLEPDEVVRERNAATLGDFTAEPVAGVVAEDGEEYVADDDEDEVVDVLGDLVVEILGDLDEAKARSVAQLHVLAQLRDLGHYHVGALRAVEGGFAVDLPCERPPSEDELLHSPTPVVFEGPLEVNGLVVRLRVSQAGLGVDESPSAVVNEIVDEMMREDGEIDVPATLVVTFRREDGLVLGDDELAVPVEAARAALAYRLGSVRTSVIEPAAEDDVVRRVVYSLDGGGELDARGLLLNLVSFRGTREFEGLGAVTCASE